MAQTQSEIAEETAQQTRFNRCIGYRAIPGTAVGSVWAVRKRDLRRLPGVYHRREADVLAQTAAVGRPSARHSGQPPSRRWASNP
jgi:hypothetical protein